jgi:hypothetical protein
MYDVGLVAAVRRSSTKHQDGLKHEMVPIEPRGSCSHWIACTIQGRGEGVGPVDVDEYMDGREFDQEHARGAHYRLRALPAKMPANAEVQSFSSCHFHACGHADTIFPCETRRAH